MSDKATTTSAVAPLVGRWEPDYSFWIAVNQGERRGPHFDLLRGALASLSVVYRGGLTLYLGAERAGMRRRALLPVPVISIGNLTSGGTGKTPMTQFVAAGLKAAGCRCVILSRGHGGALSRGGALASDEEGRSLLTAADAGDEAADLARLLPGTPVYVGRDRRVTARAALERFRPDVLLLDDGLQYWQLARALDIVLIDSRHPFDNGKLLPRGRLREPKEHLARAGIVVVTRADRIDAPARARLVATIERLAPRAATFLAYHRFAGLRPLNAAAAESGALPPGRCLPVCGIAQPASFREMLAAEGLPLTPDMIALSDHAVYDELALESIRGKIQAQQAGSVVTTDKDAVKLPADALDVPVYSAGLRLEIDRPEPFWSELARRAGEPCAAGALRAAGARLGE